MWLTWLVGLFFVPFGAGEPCSPRNYQGAFNNVVCVCNVTFCDKIEEIGEIGAGKAIVYRSTLDGDRLRRMSVKMAAASGADTKWHESVNVTITVDASERFQTIIGFGGAFTDSAGDQMAAVDERLQNHILESYFGSDGLEYNVGRVPMASCDFSTHEYSYDDVADDFELKHFALTDEDLRLKIPFIRRAVELSGGSLKLFASPWSAPGWMKSTGRMRGGGAMRSDPRVHAAYADYFVRFFDAYATHSIQFWAVTIQNEPSTGADMTWRWQTMNFTAETQRDFLRDHLGPRLKAHATTRALKVMILDDGRGLLPGWADTILNDTEARKYADGVAVHWYGDLYSPPVLLDITQRHHPDKFIFGTEACTGYFGHHGPIMGDWFRAESYADDIITDLNHHVAGWTDWNLCLDETGGPNWVYNVVDAPIIVNRTAQEFYKQPMFYAMGHFSKFVPRGSRRVLTKVQGNLAVSATSVVMEGGRRTTVILSKASTPVTARLVDASTGYSTVLNLPPRSIHTLIWDKKKQ